MKKLVAPLIALLIISLAPLFLSIAQTVNAESANPSVQNKALNFINDVLNFDESKYSASLTHYDKASALNPYREMVTYTLDNQGKSTRVISKFENEILIMCTVKSIDNTRLTFGEESNDYLKIAKGMLERYRANIGDSSVQEMRNLLDQVQDLSNKTVVVGTLSLEIEVDEAIRTVFDWKNNYNNVSYNEISLVYENSYFIFIDEHSRDKMGDTNVNITEEQAVEKAIEFVKDYSYTAMRGTVDNPTKVTIGNFNVSRERTVATLSYAVRNNLLYPIWEVNVALNNTKITAVYAIRVDIWADTGEISPNVGLQGVGGVPDDYSATNPPTNDAPSTQTPQPATPPVNNDRNAEDNNISSIDYTTVGAIAAVSVLAAVAITLFLKKK